MSAVAAAQSRALLVALRRIVRCLRLADSDAAATHGLSAAQLFVLHNLLDRPAQSLGELATRTFTDQSSVSTVAARLVADKLVTRKASRSDKRRVELSLSSAGRRVVQGAPRMPQAQLLAAIAAMPARKRAELVRSIESLAALMGADAVAPRMLFEDEPAAGRRRGRR